MTSGPIFTVFTALFRNVQRPDRILSILIRFRDDFRPTASVSLKVQTNTFFVLFFVLVFWFGACWACWGWMHRRRLVARLVLSCARLACCLSITVTLDRSRCEQRCISLRCQARAEAFAIYLLGRHRTRILLVYFFFAQGIAASRTSTSTT